VIFEEEEDFDFFLSTFSAGLCAGLFAFSVRSGVEADSLSPNAALRLRGVRKLSMDSSSPSSLKTSFESSNSSSLSLKTKFSVD
jgi:hypothetical protein